MKTDKKTLIIFLSIIIAMATIAFNFESFTGQAGRLWVLQESLESQSKGEGSVSVEPKVIEAGEKIYITIKPGDTCIDNEITIYKKDRKLPIIRFEKAAIYEGSNKGTSRYQGTGTSKYCKEATIQYKTWNNWESGDYYVEVKELPKKMTGKIDARTKYYTDDFEIKESGSYPKVIFSEIGNIVSHPQKIFGQRYIFED